MTFGLTSVSGAANEPVALDEVKVHLRETGSAMDGEILGLIIAARRRVEIETNRALVTSSWSMTLDRFPLARDYPRPNPECLTTNLMDSVIQLPKSPVQSVTSVNYIDTTGASQLLDPSAYQLDTTRDPARLVPAYGFFWPTPRVQVGAVTIAFVAGHTAGQVPEPIILAIKLLVGHYYKYPEAVAQSNLAELPMGVSDLLASYRTSWFS